MQLFCYPATLAPGVTMKIEPFFDVATFTWTYIVFDETTKDAVIIDTVLDYNPQTEQISASPLAPLLDYIHRHGLKVHYVLDTHVHADHLTGGFELSRHLKIPYGINRNWHHTRDNIATMWNLRLQSISKNIIEFSDEDILHTGSMPIHVVAIPGHTPNCSAFLIHDAIFTGDALFLPHLGTGRCDFPDGSAAELYRSITQKIYSLPKSTRIFVGHDYPANNHEPQYETTVKESMVHNIMISGNTSKREFIEKREARDKKLSEPKLFRPSLIHNLVLA